jgi:hypothetical protein
MIPHHAATNPLADRLALVLPRPLGGIAPSRREVALAAYLEAQAAARQRNVRGQAVAGTIAWLLARARRRTAAPAAPAYDCRSVRL